MRAPWLVWNAAAALAFGYVLGVVIFGGN